MRVTKKQLESKIEYLNKVAGTPETGHRQLEDGTWRSNPNHYYLQGAYGGWKLEQKCNTGGGANDPISMGFVSKRECYELVAAYIRGIEVGKESK
jgi:hypothetical protein